MQVHKEFKLFKGGKLISGTHAQNATDALQAMMINPDEVTIQTSRGHDIIFTYEGETYVLRDIGYF